MFELSSVSYDDVLYRGHSQSRVHPDSFAAMALLHGLAAPPVEGCRVLELGCGSAENLIATAYTLPGATCVGIDTSEKAISRGRRRAEEIGLPNLTLDVRSILDVDERLGRFDYIVCHGVYSWVPRPVQDKILDLCATLLVDNGVAFVSCNAYPGWHIKGMVREMMLYHVRSIADPAERAQQARAVADLVARFAKDRTDTYRKVIEEEAEEILNFEDWYLLHDNLAAVNLPLYFHEFIERAGAAGLQYLAPAEFRKWETRLDPELAKILDRIADRIRREQYLDFLSDCAFRRMLLCKKGTPVLAQPSADGVRSLYACANERPESARPDIGSDRPEVFTTPAGDKLSSNGPLVKAALACLAEEAPRATAFPSLWSEVQSRLPAAGAGPHGEDELASILLLCYRANFVHLTARPPEFASRPDERPLGSALARLQARDNDALTNLKHQLVDLDDFTRAVLSYCDGTRDREALLDAVVAESQKGDLQLLDREAAPVTDPGKIREIAGAALEPALQTLAFRALLSPG